MDLHITLRFSKNKVWDIYFSRKTYALAFGCFLTAQIFMCSLTNLLGGNNIIHEQPKFGWWSRVPRAICEARYIGPHLKRG